ncbi:MAG: GNAT family N-acetyltransferase [Planctomycetes bacterium]|nr:GNAT family N-acetyltransferase [Planctomycetota bacterium]
MIRLAEVSDIDAMVEIHMRALPGDLLPRLGRAFLGRTFYPTVLGSGHGFILVCEEEGRVRAYVIFARESAGLARDLSSRRVAIGWSILRRLWLDPRIPLDVLAFLRGRVELTEPIEDRERWPELYSIATLPGDQGKGFGAALVQEGLRRLWSAGAPGCTVKTSSDRARAFYVKNGFRDIGVETRGARRFYILLHASEPTRC